MDFKKHITFENIYFTFSMVVLLVCGIVFKSTPFILICSLLSMASNLLNAMTLKVSYIFSLVSSVMYSFSALEQHYYGEFIFNLFILTPLFIYCIFRWFVPSQKKTAAAKGDVFSITPKAAVLFAIALGIVILVYGYGLKLIGTHLPYANACSTLFVLGANFLGSRRMKEQWYLFLGSNAFLIFLWVTAGQDDLGNILYAIQNVLFIIGNVYGIFKWTRISREEKKKKQQSQQE